MILITGLSGFIGSHIARLLIERGLKVRGLIRPTSNRSNLLDIKDKIELIEGDVRDPDIVRKAVANCEACYHAAALVKLGGKSEDEFHAVNVEGTKNVTDAAMRGRVKLIYTSTCETLRPPPSPFLKGGGRGEVVTEEIVTTLQHMSGPYGRTKFLAEEYVKSRIKDGLNAVILNPTAVIGPGDVNSTPPSQLILGHCRRQIPGYFETGFNFVDARDVAMGHVLAADRGRIGERYILGNANIFLSDLFKTLEEVTSVRQPRFKLPYALVAALSYLVAWKIPPHKVKAARLPFFLDSTKARKELGWEPRFGLQESLRDAVEWYKRHRYL